MCFLLCGKNKHNFKQLDYFANKEYFELIQNELHLFIAFWVLFESFRIK